MANTVFANEVIGSKIKDILTTSVDLKNFMTIDATLTEAPGMKKRLIHTLQLVKLKTLQLALVTPRRLKLASLLRTMMFLPHRVSSSISMSRQ